jgi:hypothetical protein
MWIMIMIVVNETIMYKFPQYQIIIGDEQVAAIRLSNHKNMVKFSLLDSMVPNNFTITFSRAFTITMDLITIAT